ncbi:ATP-binding protein [Helicobacter sp. 23-1045]
MKNYTTFINAKNLSQNRFFKTLDCSLPQGRILQFLAKELLENQNNFLVAGVIESVFGKKGVEATNYICHIKSLLNLELVYLINESGEITLLELLNSYIALSPYFLKMLENGKSDFKMPKLSAYSDDFAYLKDEFSRIEILKKLAFLRRIKKQNTNIYKENKNQLNALVVRIKKRLKLTRKKLNVVDFIRANALNENEKIIFFALAKEEYHAENEKIREMDALLELISEDEMSKIRNKCIFDDGGTLLQNGLIDYDDFFSSFKKSFFIPPDVFSSIVSPQNLQSIPLDSVLKNQEIFELVDKKIDLKNIILPNQTQERLNLLIQQLDSRVINLLKSWGIKDRARGIDAKIIFYGHSGTGKTITAYALGNALKKPILSLDCSKILSMYVGESEKNVRKIFDSFNNITRDLKKDAILLLDEADQFLGQRGAGGSSVDKMYNQMQNIFLEQIEKFDGILIATTNLIDNIDAAFSRRFNYKIEFLKPDFAQRVRIWNKLLPKKSPKNLKCAGDSNAIYESGFSVKNLAKYALTGGQIKIVIKNTAYKVATKPKPIFAESDFVAEIKKEMESSFDGAKSLGFLS